MIGRSEILAGGALSARWTARRLPPVLRECGIAQKYSAWAQVGRAIAALHPVDGPALASKGGGGSGIWKRAGAARPCEPSQGPSSADDAEPR